MNLTDVDVVVVGAGLAGLSCARHLMNRSVAEQDAHVLGTHIRNMEGHYIPIAMRKAGAEGFLLFKYLNFDPGRVTFDQINVLS